MTTRKQQSRAGTGKTKSASKAVPAATGKLRIIAGEWRSRQLPVLDLPGLRPTTDRVRETLFNWLQNDVPGARCLDLFAGSGALGFEAASRGAASVTLLEMQPAAANQLAANMQLLQAQNMQLIRADALGWLEQKHLPRMVAVQAIRSGISRPALCQRFARACHALPAAEEAVIK